MTRGLNGEEVFRREDVFVGRVPGESYGYKRPLRVTVSVRLEREDRREEYETVTHEKVTKPLTFAITTAVWQPSGRDWVSGGATVEPLRELTEFAAGFNAEKAQALADLDRYHLNGLRAGCVHQTAVYEDKPYRRVDLKATLDCPETGYRYGHAWLVEVLPDDFQETLTALLPFKGLPPPHEFTATKLVPGWCVTCGKGRDQHRTPDTKVVMRSDIDRCPIHSLLPNHYRQDGSCKCTGEVTHHDA